MNALFTVSLISLAATLQGPGGVQDPQEGTKDRATRMRELSARVRVAEKELLFSNRAELRAQDFIREEVDQLRINIRNNEERLQIVEEDLRSMSSEYKALRASGAKDAANKYKEDRKRDILRQIREMRELKSSIRSQTQSITKLDEAKNKLAALAEYKNRQRRKYDERTFRVGGPDEFAGIDSSMIPDVSEMGGEEGFTPEELAQFEALFGDGGGEDPWAEIVRSIRFRR